MSVVSYGAVSYRFAAMRGNPRAALAAALLALGLASPAAAQNGAEGSDATDKLPPKSALIGVPRRAPDGSIEVVPSRPAGSGNKRATSALRARSESAATGPLPLPEKPDRPAPSSTESPEKAPTEISRSPVPAASAGTITSSAPVSFINFANKTAQNADLSLTLQQTTVISQIHNAPGWQHSHEYTYATSPFTRVVNGPGWSELGGRFNPSQGLYAYQLISPGTCTSASAGPTGTGAEIRDGTCTWKYLSNVDYISLTGWAFDNTPWRAQTYFFGDNVVSGSPLRSYRLANAAGCSSTVPPSGTGGGMGRTITLSDGCQWAYWADVIYTSGVSHIPTQTYPDNAPGKATRHLSANYQANLWNDREYIAGENGENVPIALQAHFDLTLDGFPYEPEAQGVPPIGSFRLIVTAAPGESFRDTLTPSAPLIGYDPTKGVALRNMTNSDYDATVELRDNEVDLIGLQIKSDYGKGVGGGETHGGNGVTIQNSIIDAGASNTAAVQLDASSVIANSVIISRGTFGIVEDYPGVVLHTTLIHFGDAPNTIAVASLGPWVFNPPVVTNSAIFGFAHAAAGTPAMNWGGGNNLTDAPMADSGLGLWADGRTAIAVATLPNTTYGIPAAGVFSRFPGDYRPATSSPLRGGGAAYGAFKLCEAKHPDCPGPTYNFDSTDIMGTARPGAGRYDVGAWQTPAPVTAD